MSNANNLSLRGDVFTGVVVSTKMQKTVTVEWSRKYYIPKYERYIMRRSRVKAHTPENIAVKEGDRVKIMRCRPLSKTKNFVVVENFGHMKGYEEMMEGREEAKVKYEPKTEEMTEEVKEEKTEAKEEVQEDQDATD